MNALRSVKRYIWAFVLTMNWLRDRQNAWSVHFRPSQEWVVIAIQQEVTVPEKEIQSWMFAELEQVALQVGFTIPPGTRRKFRKTSHSTLDMDGGAQSVRMRMRINVASMCIQDRLDQRYRAYIMERTDLESFDLKLTMWLCRLMIFFTLGVRIITVGVVRLRVTQQQLAVAGKIRGKISLVKSANLSYQQAAFYLAEAERCCWKPGDADETVRRLENLTEIVVALGKNLLALHELHCVGTREAWASDSGKRGSWRDVVAKIGNPFEHLGKSHRGLLKMPKTFSKHVYTFEQFLLLAQAIKTKQVDRKFIVESVVQYGMFLPPEEYERLFKLVRDPALAKYGLAGVAWLYHSNVPLKDIAACASLLLHVELPQAKKLAAEGVLPELLTELKAGELLPLSTNQIIYIHKRCEEMGTEKVLGLLKAGIVPERLQSALSLWDEYPEKSPQKVRQAIQESSTLAEARARLLGQETKTTLSVAERQTRPSNKKKRKYDGVTLPTIEMEVATRTKQSNEVQRVRIRSASIPPGLAYRKFKRGLQRENWRLLSGVGGHNIFEKGERRLYFSGSHGGKKGGINRYTLAQAFNQATCSLEEVERIVGR